jgi:hypothetical protein
MPTVVRCQCGKRLSAPDSLAGKRVACPACKAILDIPGPSGASASPSKETVPSGTNAAYASAQSAQAAQQAPASSYVAGCHCGQQFSVTPEMAGMVSTCPSCGGSFTVPAPGGFGGQAFASAPTSGSPFDQSPYGQPAYGQPAYGQSSYDLPSAPGEDDDYRLQVDYKPSQQSPFGPSGGFGSTSVSLPPAQASATTSANNYASNPYASTSDDAIRRAYLSSSTPYQQESSEGWGTMATGIGMIVLAVVWFVGGLFVGIIFFYPPILLIIGIGTFLKGLWEKLS